MCSGQLRATEEYTIRVITEKESDRQLHICTLLDRALTMSQTSNTNDVCFMCVWWQRLEETGNWHHCPAHVSSHVRCCIQRTVAAVRSLAFGRDSVQYIQVIFLARARARALGECHDCSWWSRTGKHHWWSIYRRVLAAARHRLKSGPPGDSGHRRTYHDDEQEESHHPDRVRDRSESRGGQLEEGYRAGGTPKSAVPQQR